MTVIDRIPGGLFGNDTETVAIDSHPYTFFGGQLHDFYNTPSCRIDLYKSHMDANPKGKKAMSQMTGSKDESVMVKQWMLCRFGGMDNTPDIDANNNIQEAEYVPCSKRGSCPFEGVGCCTVEVSHGVFLSKSELAIVRLVVQPDKIIADQLNISTETVKTHIQNIRRKTNCKSKFELLYWAMQKGII